MSELRGLKSKITYFRLQDFMCFEDAIIEFDEYGIISLCGYNSSGKSAVVRGLDVILYNSRQTEHIKYIRDDMEHFMLELAFDDDVIIRRFKHRDGRNIWEMQQHDNMLFTNRTNTGVFAVEGVPDVIHAYLGVLRDSETKEKLNLRRVTDKQFLIETTGGDNYKILSAILKANILAEASKSITETRNRVQNEEFSLINTVRTLENEYN